MADDLEVVQTIRWAEAGADIPARTKAHLRELGHAADEAAPSVGDRMAQAFQRLEAREPTMVLRHVRGEIAMLGAEALGTSSSFGRLASSFALLVPGGAMTLGAVGGFALVGLEIKKIIEFSDELDKSLTKLGASFATGPSALAFKAGDLRKQVEDLQSPGFVDTIKNTFMDLLTGGSATESGAAIGRRATSAATQGAANRAQLDFEKTITEEHERAVRADNKAVAEATVQIEKLGFGLHPTNVQLAGLDTVTRAIGIATSNLSPAAKERLLLLEGERGHLELVNAALKDRDEILRKAGLPGAIGMSANELKAFQMSERANVFRGRGANFGTPSVGETGLIPPGMEDVILGSGGIFGDLGRSGKDLPDILRGHAGEAHRAGQPTEHPISDAVLARILGAGLGLVGAAAGGGGPGGVISAGGALASTIPGGQIPGAVLSGLGGLVNLFGSGQAKITIARLDQEAIDQWKQIFQVAQTASVIVVQAPGGDPRATKYAIGRFDARGGVQTLP